MAEASPRSMLGQTFVQVAPESLDTWRPLAVATKMTPFEGVVRSTVEPLTAQPTRWSTIFSKVIAGGSDSLDKAISRRCARSQYQREQYR